MINEVPPFDQRNTTAELLAEYVFGEVAKRLPESAGPRRRLAVTRVEVWENDTAGAAYEP